MFHRHHHIILLPPVWPWVHCRPLLRGDTDSSLDGGGRTGGGLVPMGLTGCLAHRAHSHHRRARRGRNLCSAGQPYSPSVKKGWSGPAPLPPT